MSEYRPQGPYTISSVLGKTSLERLVIDNYPSFLSHLEKERKLNRNGKTQKLMHLEWLLKKEKTRTAKILCPYCKKRPVEYFSAVYSFETKRFSFDVQLTACGKDECVSQIRVNSSSEKVGDTLPLNFSSTEKFQCKRDRKKLKSLLKKAFNLHPPFTDNFLFDFFSN